MSYPYPQDRDREKGGKGQQPYKDAKETLDESSAELQREAIAYGDAHQKESSDERRARLKAETEKRFMEINREIASQDDGQAGGSTAAHEER